MRRARSGVRSAHAISYVFVVLRGGPRVVPVRHALTKRCFAVRKLRGSTPVTGRGEGKSHRLNGSRDSMRFALSLRPGPCAVSAASFFKIFAASNPSRLGQEWPCGTFCEVV